MQPTPLNSDADTSIAGHNTEFLSRQSMKVMIQDSATRRYLTPNGIWTTEPSQALTFRSGSTAMAHVSHKKLSRVQLVLTRAITVSEVIPVNSLLR